MSYKLPTIIRREITLKVEEIVVEERIHGRMEGRRIAPLGYKAWVQEYRLRGITGVYTAKMLCSYTNNLLSRKRKTVQYRMQKKEEEKQKQEEEVEKIREQMLQEENEFMSKEWCEEFLKCWLPTAHGS